MQKICAFILKTMGWSWSVTVPDHAKSIVCVAPHTSNWDFLVGRLFYTAIGRKINFLIKAEWFRFPFNLFFKPLGGIPVERNKRSSLTKQLVKICMESEKFNLAITPEGTRSPRKRWKKGFYYIAKEANLPIVLVTINFETKQILMDEVFTPTDDLEKDFKAIKTYFLENGKGKNPENFITGLE